MRFKLLTIVFLITAVVLVGCSKKKVDEGIVLPENFPETGNVVDISDRNDGSAILAPGDIIYLKLTGEAGSKKQWSVVSPTNSAALVLMGHNLSGLLDEDVSEFTDEWRLKVVAPDTFTLGFDYGVPGDEIEQTFRFEIIVE